MAKYLKRYAQELRDGMRKDGRTIVECCLAWGITDIEYNEFLDAHVDLQYAHTIGEMDCASWWFTNFRKLAQNGNATALAMGMKNTERVGWQDRPEAKQQEAPPIRALKITILPPRND